MTRGIGLLECFRGLVEIHDLDDAQIVIGGHDAGQHTQDRERIELGVDRGEEDVELAEEAREWRRAGE